MKNVMFGRNKKGCELQFENKEANWIKLCILIKYPENQRNLVGGTLHLVKTNENRMRIIYKIKVGYN